MSDRASLLAEAYRRGILPDAIKPHYEEAVRRGLVTAPDDIRAKADAEQRARTPAIAEPLRQFARQATLGGSEAVMGGLSAAGAALHGIPFGKAYAAARTVQDEETRERHSFVNDGAGWAGGLSSLAFGGGEIAKGASLAAKVAHGAGVGAAFGAAGGAADSHTLGGILPGAVKGGALGGVLGAGGTAVAHGVGATRSALTAGFRAPHQTLLAREGVRMAPGQIIGGAAKTAEEAMRSIPITGDAITAAHRRAQDDFNRAAVNRGLRQIGQTLPDEVETGRPALQHAAGVLGAAYDRLLPKLGVTADAQMKRVGTKVAPQLEVMNPETQAKFHALITSNVTSRFKGGKIDGQTYQNIQSKLKYLAGQFGPSGDVDHRALGEAIKTVSGELQGAARRQNPDFADALSKVDKGYAHLVLAEKAAAKPGAEGGVFTPKQYEAAVRDSNTTVRKRGTALGQDLADAGVKVLAQKLPDSGTARRVAMGSGGGALSLLVGGPHGLAMAAGGAAAGAAAYSRPILSAINARVGPPGTLALERRFAPSAAAIAVRPEAVSAHETTP